MKFYSISGLDALDAEQLETVFKSWKRRVEDSNGMVLLPNGISKKHVEVIKDLPGIKIIGADKSAGITEELVKDYKNLYVLNNNSSLFFKSEKRHQGFAVIFITDPDNWKDSQARLQKIVEKNKKESWLVMTPEVPRMFGDTQQDSWAEICQADQTRVVLSGNGEGEDVDDIFQGKWNSKNYKSSQLRVVDAEFLDCNITWCGDVDHAGFVSKDLERKRKNVISWEKHPLGTKLIEKPSKLKWQTSSEEDLQKLYVVEPEPPKALELVQSKTVETKADTKNEYNQWISFMQGLNKKSDLEYVKQKHPTSWEKYHQFFKAYMPSNVQIKSILGMEEAQPQEFGIKENPEAGEDYNLWIEFLKNQPKTKNVGDLKRDHANQWNHWLGFFSDYKDPSLTIQKILEIEKITLEEFGDGAFEMPQNVDEASRMPLYKIETLLPDWYDRFETHLDLFDRNLSLEKIESMLDWKNLQTAEDYLWDMAEENVTFSEIRDKLGVYNLQEIPVLNLWADEVTAIVAINQLMQYTDVLCEQIRLHDSDIPKKPTSPAKTSPPQQKTLVSSTVYTVKNKEKEREFWKKIESEFSSLTSSSSDNLFDLEEKLLTWVDETLKNKDFPKN